jgi:hypothetical protein
MADEKNRETEPDFPDFFADGHSIARGPFSVTVTFFQSQPPSQPPATAQGKPTQPPLKVVGRVRLSDAMAKNLANSLTQILAQPAPEGGTQIPPLGSGSSKN